MSIVKIKPTSFDKDRFEAHIFRLEERNQNLTDSISSLESRCVKLQREKEDARIKAMTKETSEAIADLVRQTSEEVATLVRQGRELAKYINCPYFYLHVEDNDGYPIKIALPNDLTN